MSSKLITCTHPALVEFVLVSSGWSLGRRRRKFAALLAGNHLQLARAKNFAVVMSVVLSILGIEEESLAPEYGISINTLRRWASGENLPPELSRRPALSLLGKYLRS